MLRIGTTLPKLSSSGVQSSKAASATLRSLSNCTITEQVTTLKVLDFVIFTIFCSLILAFLYLLGCLSFHNCTNDDTPSPIITQHYAIVKACAIDAV